MLKRRRYQAFPHVFWCSIKIGMCVWANTSQQNSLHGRWYWCWETTNPFRGLPSPFSIVLAQLPEISFPRSHVWVNTRNQPKKWFNGKLNKAFFHSFLCHIFANKYSISLHNSSKFLRYILIYMTEKIKVVYLYLKTLSFGYLLLYH